jgi:hypothetical protein
MGVRRWGGVPLLTVAVACTLLAGCANRDGLRVEGPAATAQSPTLESLPTTRQQASNGIYSGTSAGLDTAGLRDVLLADPTVDADTKAVLRTCPQRCLGRGIATDLVGNGAQQRIVTVRLLNTGMVFIAYLIGDVDGRPKVLSSIRGQDMRITAGQQRTLAVESKVYGPTDKTCCPSGSKVELYRWNGNYLVKFSERWTGTGGS